MARTKGSVNVETMRKYLAEKFPGQGWEDATDKGEIKQHYQAVKYQEEADIEHFTSDAALTEMARQNQEMGLYK